MMQSCQSLGPVAFTHSFSMNSGNENFDSRRPVPLTFASNSNATSSFIEEEESKDGIPMLKVL